MTDERALQLASPAAPDETRQRELAVEVARREAELDAFKVELQRLQARYLEEIGALYRDLGDLEAEIADIEVRAGLRQPAAVASVGADETPDRDDRVSSPCASRSPASDALKKMFRDVAKSIHPDLAFDEPARWRRHSLMAEANRAYAERDADRLRLILHAWENDPRGLADTEAASTPRRIATLEMRLAAVDAELAELRRSAIARLKMKIEKTRAEGWDLFGEMRLQVKSEVARARARLARLRLQCEPPGGHGRSATSSE
jgi:uncharacterized coiled-coil protein SlyX